MSETRTNPIVRLLPSLGDFAFLMPVVFLFGRMDGAGALLTDGDTGWHLRAGEWMLANGRVAEHDFFSFTRPGETWFAWEWLWDVAFAWLTRHGGLAALVLANVVLLGAVSALVYGLARRISGNAPVALGVTLLATAASSVHWLARPHMFTILFAAAFMTVLEKEPTWRRMAALAAAMVLWTNFHGGFLAGISLVALYAAGQLVTAVVSAEDGARRAAIGRARVYGGGLAACAAATLINPYGPRLHAHLLAYFRDPSLFSEVREFLPLDFRHPASIYFEAALFGCAAAVLWSLYRGRFAHALVAGAWAHLALFSARNIPIFAVVSTPVIALAVTEWLSALREARVADWLRTAVDRALRASVEAGEMESIPRLHLVSVAAVAAVAAILYAPARPERFDASFPDSVFPVKAAAALKRAGEPERVFAGDQWGGYLIYSRYPGRKVFVDGRSDFYGPAFGKCMLQIWTAVPGWQSHLDRYGVDAVLVPPGAPVAVAMKQSPRWRVAYDDGFAIVFRPATAAPGDAQSSAAGSSSGSVRDRAITQTQACDPKITKPAT